MLGSGFKFGKGLAFACVVFGTGFGASFGAIFGIGCNAGLVVSFTTSFSDGWIVGKT